MCAVFSRRLVDAAVSAIVGPLYQVVPGAGGGPDLVGRALAQRLSEQRGQPASVENRPGAGATAASSARGQGARRWLHAAHQHKRARLQRRRPPACASSCMTRCATSSPSGC